MRHLERQVLLTLREFVDREFKSKGPESVELLKIKNSTLIKHFKKLKGVTYIVAETFKDYVRIYFFLPQGILLGADNFEHEKYQKARKEARLLYRQAKPKEPTEADLYIEATEHVYKQYNKMVKRVQRILNLKILNEPVVFISKTPLNEQNSLFGTTRNEERVVFEERYIDNPIMEGLMIREAFRNLCPQPIVSTALCIELGNFVALKMITSEEHDNWKNRWEKYTTNPEITIHLLHHEFSYNFPNIAELVSHIKGISPTFIEQNPSKIIETYHGLHYIRNDNIAYMIEEAYRDIKAYVDKQQTDMARAIHFVPRIIPNYVVFGKTLTLSNNPIEEYIMKVQTTENNYYFTNSESGNIVKRYTHYILFQQVMPKKEGWGLASKMRNWLLRKTLGLSTNTNPIKISIEFKETNTKPEEDEYEILQDINKYPSHLSIYFEKVKEAIAANRAQIFPSFHHVIASPNIVVITSNNASFKYLEDKIFTMLPEAHTYAFNKGGFALLHIPMEWWHYIISDIPDDVKIEHIRVFESNGELYHLPDKNPEVIKKKM